MNFKVGIRHVVSDYFMDALDWLCQSSIFTILIELSTRTKQIYVFLRDREFKLPVNKITRWEKDFNTEISKE